MPRNPAPIFLAVKVRKFHTQIQHTRNQVSMQLSCGMGSMGKADMDLDGTVGDTEFRFDTKLVVHVPNCKERSLFELDDAL